MSHRKERKEKVCLNCRAEVHGRYCHVCGQENVEPKETVWHLVTHFVYDITHFDGKFFETVKYLLFKPGFLSSEYMVGRRMSYLNPIRMYVFTSAFFFLFFFSYVINENTIDFGDKKHIYSYSEAVEEVTEERQEIKEALEDSSLSKKAVGRLEAKLKLLEADSIRLKTDSTNLGSLNIYSPETSLVDEDGYSSYAAYDSAQKALPAEKRDGWLNRLFKSKKHQITDKYGKDTKAILTALFHKFFHYFPQILFVSLPLFAFLLKLLYIRRRQYYYADHAIYTIHLYCAMFIMIFIEILLARLDNLPYMHWVSYISVFFLFYIFWYIYKSMRTFYRQGRAKTVLKYLIIMFVSFFMMTIIASIFFIFSVFNI